MTTKRPADAEEAAAGAPDSAPSSAITTPGASQHDSKRVKLQVGDTGNAGNGNEGGPSTSSENNKEGPSNAHPTSSSTTSIPPPNGEAEAQAASKNSDDQQRGNRAQGRSNDNRNERHQKSGRGGGGGGGRGGGKQGRGQGRRAEKRWQPREERDPAGGAARSGERNSDNEQDGANKDGSPKLPKKKVAMLIGYSGLGYSGSQINPGVKTIESEVFAACVKAGAVSADNSDDHAKVSLMRAARTDAGVSAAINVLNLKIILNPPDLPEGMALRDYINTFLPASIRVWDIIRTQGSFHSRTMCDSRMYNYSLPSYVFLEPKPDTLMEGRVTWRDEEEKENSYWRKAAREGEGKAKGTAEEVTLEDKESLEGSKAEETASVEPSKLSEEGVSDSATVTSAPKEKGPSSFAIDQIQRKQYRIPKETLERVRETMNRFLGSHNFWNYTVGKEFSDRSCQRVMKNLTVSDPFIVGDYEWISLKFHGQSFMLHQIRKMVAMVIMVVRTHTPSSLIPETFGPARLNIPKAPALGLLLEQPRFDNYNRKVQEQNRAIANRAKRAAAAAAKSEGGASKPATTTGPDDDEAQGIRDPIQYDHFYDEVEAFKVATVVKAMHEEEERDDTYAKWMNLHDSQAGPDFDYLNAKGVIPPSVAVAKRKPEQKTEDGAGSKDASQAADKIDSDDDDEVLRLQKSGKGAADLEG